MSHGGRPAAPGFPTCPAAGVPTAALAVEDPPGPGIAGLVLGVEIPGARLRGDRERVPACVEAPALRRQDRLEPTRDIPALAGKGVDRGDALASRVADVHDAW